MSIYKRSDQRSCSSFSITSKTHRRVLILIMSFLSAILDRRRSVASLFLYLFSCKLCYCERNNFLGHCNRFGSFFLSFYHRVDNLSALYVAPSYIFSESCRIDVVLWQARVCVHSSRRLQEDIYFCFVAYLSVCLLISCYKFPPIDTVVLLFIMW